MDACAIVEIEMNQPHIRPALPADLEVIVAANLALAVESEELQLEPATLREGVRQLLDSVQPGQYWVAELDGRVVGQLLITSEWSDWRNRVVWWIQSVYVVPGARGTGVFRAMYEYIRRAAQTAGAAGLRLYVDTTNTGAQTVYAAVGMTGEHYKVFEEMFDEPPRAGTRS
jgi:GNAT superfamily N-acetyltransferase